MYILDGFYLHFALDLYIYNVTLANQRVIFMSCLANLVPTFLSGNGKDTPG